MDLLDNLSDKDRSRILNAHNFEKSFRARPSVSEDPFYTVPPGTAKSPPGTLLKVEEETDASLYTLPPNLSMSRFIYQSKTSDGALVPVSAYVLWPYAARPYHEGIPMIVWAHGTVGYSQPFDLINRVSVISEDFLPRPRSYNSALAYQKVRS